MLRLYQVLSSKSPEAKLFMLVLLQGPQWWSLGLTPEGSGLTQMAWISSNPSQHPLMQWQKASCSAVKGHWQAEELFLTSAVFHLNIIPFQALHTDILTPDSIILQSAQLQEHLSFYSTIVTMERQKLLECKSLERIRKCLSINLRFHPKILTSMVWLHYGYTISLA